MLAAGLIAADYAVHLNARPLLIALFGVTDSSRRRSFILFRVSGVTLPHAVRVTVGVSPAPRHHGHTSTQINHPQEFSPAKEEVARLLT